MAKEFVRNIKETKLRGKNIEPLYTNEQNDLLSDKKHAYIRNNDYYFPLTQAILDLVASNDDGKNPVKPKLNIDGKENTATLEWNTKALGNNFVEETPITIKVDDEFNQIKIGIDDEALYRFIKPYFTSSKDITVDFDDEKQTISYRLNDQAFFERLVSHFKDGNGLDFVIDNEFKTVHYNLKDDKIKSIIFETVEPKDDDLAVEQKDGKLLIDLSDKNTKLLKDHTESIKTLKTRVDNAMKNIAAIGDELGRNAQSPETISSDIEELKTRVDNAMKNIAALSGEVNRKAQSTENSSSEIESLKTSVQNAMNNIAALSSEIDKNGELLTKHTGEIEQHSSDVENLKIGVQGNVDDIHLLSEEINKIKDGDIDNNKIQELEENINYVNRYAQENIEAIAELKKNTDPLKFLQPIIEKYHNHAVEEKTLKKYNEGLSEDSIPSFYELLVPQNTLELTTESNNKLEKVAYARSEVLLLFVFNNDTYVANVSGFTNYEELNKNQVNTQSKELLNLKVYQEDKGFVAKFNLDDPQTVIYDLYMINKLQKL